MSNETVIVVVLICLALLVLCLWVLRLQNELSTKLTVPQGKVISTCTQNYRSEDGTIKETIVYLTLENPEELDKKTDIEVWSNFKVTKDKR